MTTRNSKKEDNVVKIEISEHEKELLSRVSVIRPPNNINGRRKATPRNFRKKVTREDNPQLERIFSKLGL
jgi:hypothetical protein